MKNLLAFVLLATIVSCSNGKEDNQEETPAIKTETPVTQTETTSVGVRDTSSGNTPVEESRQPVFPIGTYKTLPEIMKHIFSEGSTKAEVRKVQGEPDMVETIDLYQEIWYYGNCEVHFKGQIVKGVVNDDNSIRYASLYGTLIFSPDKIESDLAHFLNDRIMR